MSVRDRFGLHAGRALRALAPGAPLLGLLLALAAGSGGTSTPAAAWDLQLSAPSAWTGPAVACSASALQAPADGQRSERIGTSPSVCGAPGSVLLAARLPARMPSALSLWALSHGTSTALP